MSGYDTPEAVDPAQRHIAAFQAWENLLNNERVRVEHELAASYVDLINRYREKCAECDREKRNAMIWEKEQRMSERELSGLRSAAVSAPVRPHSKPDGQPLRRLITLSGIISLCFCRY